MSFEAGFFLNLFKFIYQIIPIKPKITVQVTKLNYTLIRNTPYDPVVIITPHPSRYNLKARVSHLRGRKTTISNACLIINNKSHLSKSDFKPFALEPGNMEEMDLSFPVDEHEASKAGMYEFQLNDIFGKKHKSKGTFPIK